MRSESRSRVAREITLFELVMNGVSFVSAQNEQAVGHNVNLMFPNDIRHNISKDHHAAF
jgi:hypothetical protein